MLLPDLIVRSRHVITPQGPRAAAIHIRGEKIVGVLDFGDVVPGCRLEDAGDLVVMPGLVDTHVHAGAEATRAAAAGGVTTMVDVPPPGPIPATLSGLESRRKALEGKCCVDVGFRGCLMPGNAEELPRLQQAGVFGFTCALTRSSVDDIPPVSQRDLDLAMPVMAGLKATLVADAGLPEVSSFAELCRRHRVRGHVLHLSSFEALTPLFRARSSGVSLTAETCPHYLYFVSDDLPRRSMARKCVPPIRERANREYLWAALANGLLQAVVSDHRDALPSLQMTLPVTWTEAQARGYTIEQVAQWMCLAPARLAGLRRKGSLEVGGDADLVFFDRYTEFTVADRRSPYLGRRLRGVVEKTLLRGVEIYSRQLGWASHPRGKLLIYGST